MRTLNLQWLLPCRRCSFQFYEASAGASQMWLEGPFSRRLTHQDGKLLLAFNWEVSQGYWRGAISCPCGLLHGTAFTSSAHRFKKWKFQETGSGSCRSFINLEIGTGHLSPSCYWPSSHGLFLSREKEYWPYLSVGKVWKKKKMWPP